MVVAMNYFASEADALTYTSPLGTSSSYTVGSYGGYSSWRLASNSTGASPQNVVYRAGDSLDPANVYYLYPGTPCFLEGTEILCEVDGVEGYMPIEQIRPGTLVKTSRDGFKKVVAIGKGTLQNPGTTERTENRLYKCSPERFYELKKDIFITGCHSILVNSLSEAERQETVKKLGKVFATDKKQRLMACLDPRAEPWASDGTYTIWHVALEHEDPSMNYGIYASGLLVESCSRKFLADKSNMTLL